MIEPNNSDNESRNSNETSDNMDINMYVRRVKDINEDLGEINLEILLVNSLKINAIKVQEVTDAFLVNKPYISIFCFTETKVDCIDFIPVGLKLFTK